MRDEDIDDDLGFLADDDYDPLLDDFEDELEEEAGSAPEPGVPMGRQEIDSIVDQVLTEELSRVRPARKTEN